MDNNRAEAERWLGVAERLLASRDLQGTRTFAIRVRDFNPILADQILAVADTLLSAQSDPIDWYRILQLAPLTSSAELVATQYRKLALLLNPTRNNLLYADQAFNLVSEAWSVLSNPSKKAIYDNDLRLGQLGRVNQQGFVTQLGLTSPLEQVINIGQQQHHHPQPPPQQQFQHQHQQLNRETPLSPVSQSDRVIQFGQLLEPHQLQQRRETETPVRKSPRSKDGRAAMEEERPIVNNRPEPTLQTEPIGRTQAVPQAEAARSSQPAQSTPPKRPKVPSFWTACPYCYVLFEYAKVYEDCTLRCQKCRRAFHAAPIPSPPVSESEAHFCSWGFFPVGFSGSAKMPSPGLSNWSPISPMFAIPAPVGGTPNSNVASQKKDPVPRVFYDDDDVYVALSDVDEDSDGDFEEEQEDRRKKAKNAKGRGSVAKNANKPPNARKGNNLNDGSMVSEAVLVAETSRRGSGNNGRRQMRNGTKNLGKLDLNVEFSNDVEEPTAVRMGRMGANGAGIGVEENIEGNAFFEGLDEFLNSLPILSVVADDKVKAT